MENMSNVAVLGRGRWGTALAVVSVSYTHLDVYKRQAGW